MPSASRRPRLIVIAIVSVLAFAARVSAAGIEHASVELTAPATYRIDLSVTADAWPVAIYPSSRPDVIDKDARPVTARTGRVYVNVPGRQRVYFHLRPAAGRTRVVALRHIPLEGAVNLRDLGGYKTASGRYVKWGLLYRSDNLGKLTTADYETMNSLGLRLICDLRTPGERSMSPTQWQGGTAPQIMTPPDPPGPVNPRAGQAAMLPGRYARLPDDQLRKLLEDIEAGRATPQSEADYSRFPTVNISIFKAFFSRVAGGDVPTLIHCTAGQDRTGVLAAIVLLALGVPRDTVIEDYLLTNQYRRPDEFVERVRQEIQQRLRLVQPPSAEAVRFIEDMNASYIQRSLDAIDKEYGSFQTYLDKGLDMSPARVEQLRSRLLED